MILLLAGNKLVNMNKKQISSKLASSIEERRSKMSIFFHDAMEGIGEFWFFMMRFFVELFNFPFERKEFIRQAYQIGNRSLVLVLTTGFIMGVVLTIQSKPTLEDFGAESWLPNMVAVSIIREIGPVITAIICAGKFGSGRGAVLGSMRVTEQIDAMEVSGANPYKYLVVTRVMASTFMLPVLVFFADFIGLMGSYLGVNISGDVSLVLFMSRAMGAVDFTDIIPATIKSVIFGFVIGIIGCYKGYNASKGTESVGKASNEAVVAASLMVFVVGVIVVQITYLMIT
jgi:phospholipid/cholesterol/gamma-HCH transport system permease protein